MAERGILAAAPQSPDGIDEGQTCHLGPGGADVPDLLFFSSRRRHTRLQGDGVQTCALPIWTFEAPCAASGEATMNNHPMKRKLLNRIDVLILHMRTLHASRLRANRGLCLPLNCIQEIFIESAGRLPAARSASSSNHMALSIANAHASPSPNIQLKYHMISSSIVAIRVGLNLPGSDRAAQYVINPRCIGEHDRQKQDHRDQHDAQCPVTARGIPDRQAACWMRGRR